MRHYKEHLIQSGSTIREALKVLDRLAKDAISFIVDEEDMILQCPFGVEQLLHSGR